MKKILTLLAVLLASASIANAQFGVVGGFTSSRTSLDKNDALSNLQNVNLYHIGVAYKIESGSLFTAEPTLAYEVKGASLYKEGLDTDFQKWGESLETRTGYVQLSLGMQVGLDLLVFRPFFVFEPYVGYAVTGSETFEVKAEGSLNGTAAREDIQRAANEVKNKLEYGFGIGGGVELLNHLQLSVQWFKNLGSLYNEGKIDASQAMTLVGGEYKDIQNYTGIKLSLAVFF